MGILLERSALVLLVLLLAWAPLPVGSNRPWSKALLAELAAGVVLVGACGLLLRGLRVVMPRRLAVAALLAAGALGWAWLQADPRLPATWAHPLWGELARAGLPAVPTVSLDPAATRTAVPLLASYFLLFALAFALSQEARHARVLAAGVVAVATGWALWGIVRFLAGMDLLFYAGEPASDGVSANFPNYNHFATYANLAFLVAAARLGQRLLQPGGPRLRFRIALSEAVTHLLERRAPWFAAAVVLLAASLGSTSRGGFLSLLVAFSFLVALLTRRAAVGLGRAILVPIAAAGLVLTLVALTGSGLLERLDQLDLDYVSGDIAGPGRLAAWQVALALVAERPWLGHGYATFAQAFPLLADQRFTVLYDYAHDTYLEDAVELGLPAAAALCLAVALAASLCLRGGVRGRAARALPLAAAAGSVAVAVHSLVDFGVQIPAIAATYAVILGVGCGRAVGSAEEVDREGGRQGRRRTAGGTIMAEL